MNKIDRLLTVCLGFFLLNMLFFSCGKGQNMIALTKRIDSLNQISYANHYKDLNVSYAAAQEAVRLSVDIPENYASSLNNLGFCAFMRMDFEKARSCFQTVLEKSTNEIECLVADVGMMKICQRASLNKEFFDYRNEALRRMNRISSDNTVMVDSMLSDRYNYALSEFYIVTSVYYYYLQQDKESEAALDAVPHQAIQRDTAQWLYYMYMRGSGGMFEASTHNEVVLAELGFLLECLDIAHKKRYTYFEANSLQAMAELLNMEENRDLVMNQRAAWFHIMNPEGVASDSLPLMLANRALQLFKQYGDWYQISGTYRTIATYYNYIGKPEMALNNLEKALEFVNLHHSNFYHCNDTIDRLLTYRKDIPYSVELKWINDEGIMTVPEWVARLREQLSRTYSAMGMKTESDYNRNVYLDILDYTRQDKELESRYLALETESRQLNILLLLVGLGFVVLVVLFFWLNSFWKRRYSGYLDELRMVLGVCRKITAAVPPQAVDRDEVAHVIRESVGDDLLALTHASAYWISWIEEEVECPEWVTEEQGEHFDLIAPGKDAPVGVLWLQERDLLTKDERSLVQLILPYLAWTLENGLNLASLSDERVRLEKEQYIHHQHLVENKRQNEVKKTCLAIVMGIVPYIDRVVNEVHKLCSAEFAREKSVKQGKLKYISELLGKINEYNDILALWIKMRQGVLSLNVENFELDELFKVIVKGRRTFEMREQQLIVKDTDAVVKADKALTLFMINTLTENARKYTPRGGRVEVTAIETEHYVEVSVSDNGPGLSEKDVHRILSEKVYDSGSIGMETTKDVGQLQKQKGHGFGLMNCKGIIDKYKKTNPLFDVCLFSIESKLGEGSRFYFRLPKGVRRTLQTILLPLLITFMGMGVVSCQQEADWEDVPQKVLLPKVSEIEPVVTGYDSLLAIANEFANRVYDCNVKGRYQRALTLADSVLYYMNVHYLKYSSISYPLLSMNGQGEAAELVWLANGFDTDYFILLDVRNEIAVACLALKDFKRYDYNNLAYTTLYKQVSEDKSLEGFCVKMQRSSNSKTVALTLFVFLVLGCLVAYYILYWRRRLHYRYNLEQVFSINKAAFSATAISGKESEEMRQGLVKGIFNELNELVPIENLVLAVKEEGMDGLRFSNYQPVEEELLKERIRWCYERQEVEGEKDNTWYCLPLQVHVGGEDYHVGVLALNWGLPSVHEEDKLLVKLIAGYLAVVLYNSIVQVERKYHDIELAQDEARRALYEENMLHVQNLVLDNCLSTIKHETIYYPNRIRQIVERMVSATDRTVDGEEQQFADMSELVSYYKDVFTLLASCASRQLDEVTFKRNFISSETLVAHVRKYYKKITRKRFIYPELEIESESVTIIGDEILLEFLLENLLDEAILYESSGNLLLKLSKDGDYVRFDFTDFRRSYSQEELNLLFYPDHAQICQGNGCTELSGTEYLICKQVVREHDEFSGRRGCRINACPVTEGEGFTVWFTIPRRNV